MSDERQMLRDSVAALIKKRASPEAVRAAMASDRGYDEALWTLLCEQVGAAALVVPEELGGAGGELADAAAVIEELGKRLVPTPWKTSPRARSSGRSSSIRATSSTVTSPTSSWLRRADNSSDRPRSLLFQ